MNNQHPRLSRKDRHLLDQWQTAWPSALSVWSKFTRLSDPRLCVSTLDATMEGLSGSFAMIRLVDQRVVIDLQEIRLLGLEEYAVEILAHEIGHHVLAPATVTDQLRLLARLRKALPTLEMHSALLANLYTDLLINDRLQRRSGLRMAAIYRVIHEKTKFGIKSNRSGLWAVYLRIYENLWQLQKGTLGGATNSEKMDTDAWLGARLIRVYADEWLDGAGRFATLLLPYLVDDIDPSLAILRRLHDTKDAAQDAEPFGITDIVADEDSGVIHPADDTRITGHDNEMSEPVFTGDDTTCLNHPSNMPVQHREPFEYGEILRAAGITLSDHELAVRYYRERALPYLVPFPVRPRPTTQEPLMEGLEPWDIGDPLDDIDWFETLSGSPTVFAGMTTMKRRYGYVEGDAAGYSPIDLDIYIDSSGSMPNPQVHLSYPALAGTIIAMSALRAGSKVQTTLWSGKNQVITTDEFVRDENRILRVITGFFGGATAFPVHKLRNTYSGAWQTQRKCHILMISDDGITTMFDDDEQGNSGWDISANALKRGDAGGTMALNIPSDWQSRMPTTVARSLRRAISEQTWEIHAIVKLEDLIEFARDFSRKHYMSNTVVSANREKPV